MDQLHYKEMKQNLEALIAAGTVSDKTIYIFGHCNATEELVDLLAVKGYPVSAILDNNPENRAIIIKGFPSLRPVKY